MAKINHIALKVNDIEEATQFYVNVFGFRQMNTSHRDGHTSRHLTDGTIDLALLQYESEDTPEAQMSGRGECIHHFGIEVDEREKIANLVLENGGEILSEPDAKAIKFRTPHGVIAELIRPGEVNISLGRK